MSQLLLINPRRRRRHKKSARRHRRGARKMSALQLKYFGKRRARRRSRTIYANPRKRRRARRSSARRSYRRSMRSAGRAITATAPGVIRAVQNGVIGGAGAVVVDMAMGQAARFLPVNLTSRYGADGTLNWSYYATKAALAIAVGVAGQRFLPGNMRRFAAQGAEGALVVMSYEVLRSVLPPTLTMGYFNPATVTATGNVTSMGKYLSQRPGMGKYLSTGGGSAWSGHTPGINTRVGEGTVL